MSKNVLLQNILSSISFVMPVESDSAEGKIFGKLVRIESGKRKKKCAE